MKATRRRGRRGGHPGSDGASSAGDRREGRAGTVVEESRGQGPAGPRPGKGLTQQQFFKSFDGVLPAFPSRRCRSACRLLA